MILFAINSSTLSNGDFFPFFDGYSNITSANMILNDGATYLTGQPMTFSNLSVGIDEPDLVNDLTITLMTGGDFVAGSTPTPVSTGISVTMLAGTTEASDSTHTYNANGFEVLSMQITSAGALTGSDYAISLQAVLTP